MQRYFIQLSYKGTHYSGFQKQDNANSIQAEVERALKIFFRKDFELTCSSRTDAGVHALENYFHFDSDIPLFPGRGANGEGLNAILPPDIVIKRIFEVAANAHSRFEVTSRTYKYTIYRHKDPFLEDRAYFFPFKLDPGLLQEAAVEISHHEDFTSFSKRNTQVKNFNCKVTESRWTEENNCLVYQVTANRFLRGMVRGFVGTMLQVGTGKISLAQFRSIIKAKDCTMADFSVPPQGLFLATVTFPVVKTEITC